MNAEPPDQARQQRAKEIVMERVDNAQLPTLVETLKRLATEFDRVYGDGPGRDLRDVVTAVEDNALPKTEVAA